MSAFEGAPSALDPHVLADLRRVFAGVARPALGAVVDDFLESGPRRLNEIAEAVARRDVEASCWAAQALAGAARLLGAQGLADLCVTLEETAQAQSWAQLHALLDGLTVQHDQVRHLVEDEFGAAARSVAKPRHAPEGED